ncbi:MAG: hypothetical protein AAF846_19430 [Chloroflexota bacterium]
MIDTTTFEHIEEGMTVITPDDNEVGTVEFVQYADGGSEAELPEIENIMDVLADALTMNTRHPKEVYERLYLNGFIRIERGLEPDKYAMPEQIECVTDDTVYLNVAEEELLDE